MKNINRKTNFIDCIFISISYAIIAITAYSIGYTRCEMNKEKHRKIEVLDKNQLIGW